MPIQRKCSYSIGKAGDAVVEVARQYPWKSSLHDELWPAVKKINEAGVAAVAMLGGHDSKWSGGGREKAKIFHPLRDVFDTYLLLVSKRSSKGG